MKWEEWKTKHTKFKILAQTNCSIEVLKLNVEKKQNVQITQQNVRSIAIHLQNWQENFSRSQSVQIHNFYVYGTIFCKVAAS